MTPEWNRQAEQRILNKVWLHLRQQGARSVIGVTGSCRYRGPQGMKCAIGCLIPDSKYRPQMEGINVGALLRECKSLKRLIPFKDLLLDLQNVHDTWPVDRWEKGLRQIARERWLEPLSPPVAP